MVKFNDVNIEKLFGVSDAENERPERLKEYFFKNRAYENLANDLAIRILVGHKGSGKSALLKILYTEDYDAGQPAIWLQPGDVLNAFEEGKGNFTSWIEGWKTSLINVIANQVIQEIQPEITRSTLEKIPNVTNSLFKFLTNKINQLVSNGGNALQADAVERFREKKFIRVYIDDLDRGWEARPDDIKRISALLNAVRDICGPSNSIQFRIGLRTDVYYLVRTSDESTDKIEDKVVWLEWSNHDLLVLFAKRIQTFAGKSVDEYILKTKTQNEIARSFHEIIEPVFRGRGKWESAPIHRVIMSLQRKRPRDLVKLLGGAAKAAFQNNHEIITTSDLQSTFEKYSAERLQDIVNEFSSEMVNIRRLLLAMKPTKKERHTSESYVFNQSSLDTRLNEILKQVPVTFTNKSIASSRSVGQFLYKIDFIIARKLGDDGSIIRRYFDQSRFLYDQYLDFGFMWEIHPAYRWALQPDTLQTIFEEIALED